MKRMLLAALTALSLLASAALDVASARGIPLSDKDAARANLLKGRPFPTDDGALLQLEVASFQSQNGVLEPFLQLDVIDPTLAAVEAFETTPLDHARYDPFRAKARRICHVMRADAAALIAQYYPSITSRRLVVRFVDREKEKFDGRRFVNIGFELDDCVPINRFPTDIFVAKTARSQTILIFTTGEALIFMGSATLEATATEPMLTQWVLQGPPPDRADYDYTPLGLEMCRSARLRLRHQRKSAVFRVIVQTAQSFWDWSESDTVTLSYDISAGDCRPL